MLPPGVTVTPLSRRIFAHLEKDPDAKLREIMAACRCSKDRAHYWRKIWLEHRDELREAPPPAVRHRIEAVDPLSVFPPATSNPARRTSSAAQASKEASTLGGSPPPRDEPAPAPRPDPTPDPEPPARRRIREYRI